MKNLEELTDEELALRYVEGDNRAFDLLLSRNEETLFAYILFVVHDREQANDVFQETFVKVISRMQNRQYTANGKFSAWLIRIAHNVMMDMYRGVKGKFNIQPNETNDLSNVKDEYAMCDNIESDLVKGQVLSDVKKMMNLLPPVQREVVFMRYYQELSFKEIAEITNVSINTSLGRMRYAILNLRRMAREHHVSLQLAMF